MKRLTSLWRALAADVASGCGISTAHDINTVVSRVEAEGESFLTITLPQYCKDFERSLELGSVADYLFSGFQRRGGLPLFLGGFLRHVFDTKGVLLDEPCISCIRSVRQLTLVFGKIERPCAPRRVRRAMRGFVELEQELSSIDSSSFEEFLPLFRKASTLLWGDVFSDIENVLTDKHHLAKAWLEGSSPSEVLQARAKRGHYLEDPLDSILGLPKRRVHKRSQKETVDRHVGGPNVLTPEGLDKVTPEHWPVKDREIAPPIADPLSLVPRHGPGATADRLAGNRKYDIRQWPTRLDDVFPYVDYAIPNWRYYSQLDHVEFLEPGAEVPVKVTPVPKTLKTPRIIAIEPTAMQYAQQAIAMQIVDRLENGLPLPPTGGGKDSALGRFFVGFQDQEANRVLAKEGSINNCLATLDLSDASDRVLNQHVLLLFSRFPRLSAMVQACRSTKADVPGYGVIPLTKYASMGSALCFPVEAMVFTTIVFAAIAHESGTPLDRALIHSMRGKVRVYGDDIVVPVEYVQSVIQFLEAFGLRVNKDKSFWNGKFRESCGGDFYDGEWVTPVRLRHDLPRSRKDVDEAVSVVSFRNLLYWSGYWKVAAELDERVILPLFKGHFPIVEDTAAGLGRSSVLPYREEWIDPRLHSPRVKTAVVKTRIPKSETSGVGNLLKFVLKQGNLPSQDAKHLERSGRPIAARIKLRGTLPY